MIEAMDNTYTVLYIEDNLDNILLVRKIFERRKGIQMIDAIDANQGIRLAIERQPDLILLDINLPGKDGFMAMSDLQKNEKTKDIPVIGLSANADQANIQKGISAGFKEYITKPFDIPQFLGKIDEVLGFNS